MAAALPARAARPLPDAGRWDRVFALYARDVQVPWRRVSVRVDTYSGAPVEFAAYRVDPADVLVAGANARPRAIDTARRKPVAHWRFTPPPGLTYEASDVEVPVHGEGFYVVEARRGDASQQVWLDLTRVGLVSKESPGGIVLYGCDLGTGRALAGMRVTALVGSSLVDGKTDAHGVLRFAGDRRPRFALAEWGSSSSFVAFLPSSPIPPSIVGVRVDRAAVRAGEALHVVGFARRRVGNVYRPASGDVHLALVARGRTLAAATVRLDAAGAFADDLPVAAGAAAGDAAVIATAGGASGGAQVRIDGVGDVALAIGAACRATCAPDAALPLTVAAVHDGAPVAGIEVRVRVVRSPHVLPPGARDAAGWGTTAIVDALVRTDAAGVAHLTIPAPTDGLASTYGVDASSGASTAALRLVAPAARLALAVVPERTAIDPGETAAFVVRGFDAAEGTPARGLAVRVRLVHGPTVQQQTVTLDVDGRAHVAFHDVAPGTQIATAEADVDGKHVVDAAAIAVTPGALGGASARRSAEVTLATDAARYRAGTRVGIEASLAGAAGDAFVTLDGARTLADAVVPVADGRAAAQLVLPESVGDASAGVAFVRDGAIHFATRRLAVDGPGHARAMALDAGAGSFAPGATARFRIDDGGESAGATLAIRVADGASADGARFEDVADALAAATTTTQASATADPAWHGSVTPQRSTATDAFGAGGARPAAAAASLAVAGAAPAAWRIDRLDRDRFEVALPTRPGRYTVSVLKIGADGDVGAAALAVTVR